MDSDIILFHCLFWGGRENEFHDPSTCHDPQFDSTGLRLSLRLRQDLTGMCLSAPRRVWQRMWGAFDVVEGAVWMWPQESCFLALPGNSSYIA